MSTRGCQGTDSVIKPLDTIPEDKKVRVQRTQSGFDPFEKPTSQVKRVHSENNACINAKSSSSGKESPKLRRHSSPSSVQIFDRTPTVLAGTRVNREHHLECCR
ncbi:Cyclin-dependent kinase 14 [Ataeniobius toweri]|uniref:Cyclin-dependent kinase 14 n=1 Tax=Ataeniobius toweri TaxID=208326 RepID=A0ABU7B6J4_9TELE|nr:Cyclin-dependent kinase 14 [Ataeniobius toweri]